jgi:asparagine synthase (glutamine-hydrolysing)
MCGIVGIAASAPGLVVPHAEAMAEVLCHRGPNDSGVWIDSSAGMFLGHRRLSVVDLSPAGHQPMWGEARDSVISFNGEIYNFHDLRRELTTAGHTLASRTDTEVILAAYRQWGPECVSRFEGMFAFALYDSARRRLFLARDRAGEKPLFFRHDAGRLSFASELKALLADPAFPRRVDPVALEFYLAYGYVPAERCILQGVNKLPPASAALYDLASDDLRIWQYWRLPEHQLGDASPEELTDELEALLGDSVSRQMVADVPLGVLLSGGLDSSIIAALAARSSTRRVKTFTVGFPSAGKFDERPYARRVASFLGTEHHEFEASPATVDLLPLLARQYDEPLADSSIVPTFLVSRLVSEHCVVALGGDGGDELFGGYDHYSLLQHQERLRELLPGAVRKVLGRVGSLLPMGSRGKNHLTALGGDMGAAFSAVNLYFGREARSALLGGRSSSNGAGRGPERFRAGLGGVRGSAVRQATVADFLSYLPDNILVKVDRASMLNSLEVRAPFLDRRVVEFAFGRVPDRLRAHGGERKILLRRLGSRLLPPELDLTRKQGFSPPLDRWFRGEWGSYMESVLLAPEQTLFDHGVIRRMAANQRKGLSNTNRLFALCMFELWRREYRVQAG